jgi:uncharacterized protein YndB with AHSA1/START domain
VWSAITDPARLAGWWGAVEGDLQLGGEYRERVFASGCTSRTSAPTWRDVSAATQGRGWAS